ncbi:MAG: CotH kinase family protein [Bacteroidales bacterium]|nr:CotH kinase family protein [Bacteroidales bacterium]
MKKNLILILLLIPSVIVFSQSKVMKVLSGGNVIYSEAVANIDSITFSTDSDDEVQHLYDITKLPVFKFEISTENWNNFLSYFDQNPKNEEYIHVDLYFQQGNHYDTLRNSGFKMRGNTSRRRPEGSTGEVHHPENPDWHHASFSVNVKKWEKNQRILGEKKVNLKWFKDDANYCREVYCYDLFRRFGIWTALQSSYCQLYIKIKEDAQWYYFGIYEMLEPIDDDFVKARENQFVTTGGHLWKANYPADFNSTDESQMGIEDVTLTYTYEPVYDYKTDNNDFANAKAQLVDFISNVKNLNGTAFKDYISNKMDVDFFLKTYAVNVICGMWDDHWANANNFYFYFDENGKFFFIPYDYDNTLGTSLIVNDAGTQNLLQWGDMNNRPLMTKILAIPEYKTIYINYLHELCNPANNYFDVDKSIARIQNWHRLINGKVLNDTGEDMYIEDKPAVWGNQPNYRLFTKGSNNFFQVRATHLPSLSK